MFSPLALTQTLPFLPLAQGDIDYQVARRGDPDLFDTLFADPRHQGHPGAGRPAGRAARSGQCRQLCLREHEAEHAAGARTRVPPWPSTPKWCRYSWDRMARCATSMWWRSTSLGCRLPARPRRFRRRRSVPTRRLMPTAMLPVRSRLTGWTCWNRPWNGSTGWICAGSPRTPTPARPDRPRPR